MSARRLSRDEIGIRDSEIYELELRSKLEATALDQFIAIDVETAEHEVADEAHLACDRVCQTPRFLLLELVIEQLSSHVSRKCETEAAMTTHEAVAYLTHLP